MYVIVEDLTNQRVYCENAIFIHGTVDTLDERVSDSLRIMDMEV